MTANKKKTIEIYENTPYNTFINNKLPKIQRCHKVKNVYFEQKSRIPVYLYNE